VTEPLRDRVYWKVIRSRGSTLMSGLMLALRNDWV
jgi:hypothetical protein